jgi:hypothetical protein
MAKIAPRYLGNDEDEDEIIIKKNSNNGSKKIGKIHDDFTKRLDKKYKKPHHNNYKYEN